MPTKTYFEMNSKKLMPREKLLSNGAESLTDYELLAIFLRTGIKNCPVLILAEIVLNHFGSLRNLLSADHNSFCQIKGLGPAQFIQLQACKEMTKRYLSQELQLPSQFMHLENARLFIQAQLEMQEREVFMVLFLTNQHQLLHAEKMFLGSISSAAVYPREIIKAGLAYNAAAIILAHNHPSGIVHPSEADKNITQQIINACDLVEIRVLDHFIVGKGKCFSFYESGLIK